MVKPPQLRALCPAIDRGSSDPNRKEQEEQVPVPSGFPCRGERQGPGRKRRGRAPPAPKPPTPPKIPPLPPSTTPAPCAYGRANPAFLPPALPLPTPPGPNVRLRPDFGVSAPAGSWFRRRGPQSSPMQTGETRTASRPARPAILAPVPQLVAAPHAPALRCPRLEDGPVFLRIEFEILHAAKCDRIASQFQSGSQPRPGTPPVPSFAPPVFRPCDFPPATV